MKKVLLLCMSLILCFVASGCDEENEKNTLTHEVASDLYSHFSEDFEVEYDEHGQAVLKKYLGDGGDVIIPDGINIIGEHAFDGILLNKVITSVYIPDSVTTISDYAFLACWYQPEDDGLKNVRMSSSIEYIGASAFADCAYLEQVVFDEMPRELICDDSAFAYCSSLKSLDLPDSTLFGEKVFIGTALETEYAERYNSFIKTPTEEETLPKIDVNVGEMEIVPEVIPDEDVADVEKSLEQIVKENQEAITNEIYSLIYEAEKVRYDIRDPAFEIVSTLPDRLDCVFTSEWEWIREAKEDPMILGMYEVRDTLTDEQEIEFVDEIIQGWIAEIEGWYGAEIIETRLVIKQDNDSWILYFPHIESGQETLYLFDEYVQTHWTEDFDSRKQGGIDIIIEALSYLPSADSASDYSEGKEFADD